MFVFVMVRSEALVTVEAVTTVTTTTTTKDVVCFFSLQRKLSNVRTLG